MKKKISVVIPVYNSRKTLDEITRRIMAAMQSLASRYEIILVNDGSRDDSWDLIQALMKKNPAVIKGFNLMRNLRSA